MTTQEQADREMLLDAMILETLDNYEGFSATSDWLLGLLENQFRGMIIAEVDASLQRLLKAGKIQGTECVMYSLMKSRG